VAWTTGQCNIGTLQNLRRSMAGLDMGCIVSLSQRTRYSMS
jgi:hypothetical protein